MSVYGRSLYISLIPQMPVIIPVHDFALICILQLQRALMMFPDMYFAVTKSLDDVPMGANATIRQM